MKEKIQLQPDESQMHVNLPLEIFRVIQEYLNQYDYRQLLNSSLTIFKHVKYETVYYNLRISWNQGIQTEKIIDYLVILYESVKDKSKQISLSLSGFVQEVSSFIVGIHKLVYRDYENRNMPQMSVFWNVYYRQLEGISDINHLSGLSGVKVLHIFSSESIERIDFIPGLKKLIIDSLPNLFDISDYRSIPAIEIKDCPKLNLRAVGKHERFCIIGSNHRIDIDLSRFRKVRYLTIQDTSSKGLDKVLPSFPYLTHLSIYYSNISSEVLFPSTIRIAEFNECSFNDLFVLSKIKELKFYNCKGREFNNVESLSNAYGLGFYNIPELQNVNCLERVHDLSIVLCKKVKDISDLGRFHRLSVEDCKEVSSLVGLREGNREISLYTQSTIIDFSPLGFIYKVTLSDFDGLVDGKGLADVKILTICKCKHFKDTSALTMVQSLCLILCNQIEKLADVDYVPYIYLETCENLEDISCLGKQKSLIIKDCKTLQKLMKKDVGGYNLLFQRIKFLRIDPTSQHWMTRLGFSVNKNTKL